MIFFIFVVVLTFAFKSKANIFVSHLRNRFLSVYLRQVVWRILLELDLIFQPGTQKHCLSNWRCRFLSVRTPLILLIFLRIWTYYRCYVGALFVVVNQIDFLVFLLIFLSVQSRLVFLLGTGIFFDFKLVFLGCFLFKFRYVSSSRLVGFFS